MKLIKIPRNRISAFIILSLTLSVLCTLSGCGSSGNIPGASTGSYLTRSGFCFDTLISITLYNNGSEELLNDCFDMCTGYENLLSMTVSGSDISRINAAGANEPVTVSSDTIDFIEAAIEYYDRSDGLLDISVAPLTQLWTDARNEETPPDNSRLEQLLPHTGLDKLSCDRALSAVTKSDGNLMLDPGALGKGFVADRLKEMIIERGVDSAIISLGGNILTIGSKPNGSGFRIGIKKPFSEYDDVAASLRVKDLSVVTSGVYERYFVYDNRLYHHILDPETGSPAATDLYSVTIISNSSLDGDALSTICLLEGLEEASRLIENTPGVEAVFITEDNELHYTGGASEYLENK